jgi:ribose transport system ATP-binding protein
MDEPTSSLTRHDAERLFAVIGRLKAQGVSILYVSHFLEECRRICDRYTVLRDGEVTGGGAMAATNVDGLVSLMTGRAVSDLYPRRSRRIGAPVLEVTGLSAGTRLSAGSFVLREGEILGLAGLIGAGRTELLRAVFGLDRPDSGAVLVAGSGEGRAGPAARWRQGVGFLSENRKEEGLMLDQSIQDNMTLTKLEAFGRLGWISSRRQAAAARRWTGELAIRCRGTDQLASELSGGNQQKVALGRLLEHPARIFLLDEPTRGIDVGSKAQVYEIIGRLADAGKSVVVASSYLPELLGLCDTIAVMRRGSVAASAPREAWTESELLKAAVGAD